jgi:hypothetical protein
VLEIDIAAEALLKQGFFRCLFCVCLFVCDVHLFAAFVERDAGRTSTTNLISVAVCKL